MVKVIFLIFLIISSINIPSPKTQVVNDLDFSLYFDSQYAYLYLHKKRRGYLAVGIGAQNMASSNVIILDKTENGNNIILKDCWSYGEMPFNCNKEQLFEIMDRDINPNKLEVLIRRNITVNSPLSISFNTTIPNGIIYGFTDHEILEYHYGKSAFFGSFEYFQNNWFNLDNRTVLPIPSALLHGFTNIFLWILFCDVVIILAKFFKTIKYYSIIHAVFLFGVLIYTFLMIYVIWGKRVHRGRNYPPHFYASVGVLFFTILEFFSGIFLTIKLHFDLGKWNTLISKKKTRWIHGILGFFSWLAVRVACIYGAEDLVLLFNIYIYLYLIIAETAIFVIVFCCLFYLYYNDTKYYNIKMSPKPNKIDPIINVIENSNFFDLMKINSKRKIVFYKNRVYDIGKIIHPGGEYIFNYMKFRDVTRFLFGSYGLELNNSESWLHTNFALSLLEKNYLGNLNLEYNFIKNSEHQNKYKLSSKKNLENDWNIYYFKNEKVKVENYITKLSEIATYFNIKNKVGTFRNYTTIMSATKYNLKLNNELLNYIEALIKNEKYEFNFKAEEIETNILPFVVKTYKSKIGVSEYLFSIKENDEVQIEGPFGEGLYLKKNNKNITLITGGTGILPVYDLIDLVFKKACLEFLKSKNIKLNIPELKAGELIENFKITLISSFRSDEEFFGIPYLNLLVKMQNILKLNLMEVNIKFSKKPTKAYDFQLLNKRLDKELILEKIQNRQENIYICGPPLMNNSAYNLLRDNYYENIYLV